MTSFFHLHLFAALYALLSGDLASRSIAEATQSAQIAAPSELARANHELAAAQAKAAAAAAAAEAAAIAATTAAATAKEAAKAQELAMAAAEAAGAAIDRQDKGAAEANVSTARLHTVPLQKQLVPVMKNGRLVANKTAFFGQIRVGNPQQSFTVVFDTGSGHLILPSTTCDSETCKKHTRYDRSASDTAIDVEADGSLIPLGASERDQVSIAFGTGEVLGEFIQERVCVGSESEECVSMRVVVARQMTPDPFGVFAFDGVLGIGLNALALNDKFSFFSEMVGQHPTMQPYFAVFLARTQNDQSAITFGGIDLARATSDIQWTPVVMQELGFWQVQVRSVKIGDTELDVCSDGQCRAILDTGTSLLGVPRSATRALSRHLARPAPQDSSVNCLDVEGPELKFDLGGMIVSLGARDYSQSAPVNVSTVGGVARSVCRSLLMPVDMGGALGSRVFVWGEPVLRKYYTVYDFAQKRVGFTVAKGGAQSIVDSATTV